MLTEEQRQHNHEAYLKYKYRNKVKRYLKMQDMSIEEEEALKKKWRLQKILDRVKKNGKKKCELIVSRNIAETARFLESKGYEVSFKNKQLKEYYLEQFTEDEKVKYGFAMTLTMNLDEFDKKYAKYEETVFALNKALKSKFNFIGIRREVIMSVNTAKYYNYKFYEGIMGNKFNTLYLNIWDHRKEIIKYLVDEFDLEYKSNDYRKQYATIDFKDMNTTYTLAKLKGY